MSSAPPPPFSPQPPPPRVPHPPPPVASGRYTAPRPVHPVPEGSKSYVATLVLSFFLGVFGADRFYLGKNRSAVWKLVTLGGFGYWWLFDLLFTLFGGQRDQWGLRLDGYDRNKKKVWVAIGIIYGASLAVGLVGAGIAASFDASGPTAFGWIAIATLAAAAAAAGTVWFVRRRRAKNPPAKARRGNDPVPPRIRARLDEFVSLRPLYVLRAATGDSAASNVIGQIDSLVADSTALFHRLGSKADKAERGRAEAEYEDKLGKLADALHRDYLLDILANPRLWESPETRIREVREAMDAVDEQIVDNIKQVNAHRGMVFQVRLNTLRGTKGEMDDWQRDFDGPSARE